MTDTTDTTDTLLAGRSPGEHLGGETCPLKCYTAELLSPGQVQQRAAHYPQEGFAQVRGHWLICARLSPELFGLFAGLAVGAPTWSITAGTTAAGASYAAIVGAVLGFAHAILLPLYEPGVCRMARAMAREPLALQGSLGGKRETLVVDIEPAKESFARLLPLCGEMRGDRLAGALAELPAVIRELAEAPSLLSGAARSGLAQVEVSIVPPREAAKSLAA